MTLIVSKILFLIIALDTLYACYQVKKEAERADIMYEIWSNSGIHDLKLEDVMQHGDGGLQGFDQFLLLCLFV
jgi:hypothetical protein